jgi:hypothetical protein
MLILLWWLLRYGLTYGWFKKRWGLLVICDKIKSSRTDDFCSFNSGRVECSPVGEGDRIVSYVGGFYWALPSMVVTSGFASGTSKLKSGDEDNRLVSSFLIEAGSIGVAGE